MNPNSPYIHRINDENASMYQCIKSIAALPHQYQYEILTTDLNTASPVKLILIKQKIPFRQKLRRHYYLINQ